MNRNQLVRQSDYTWCVEPHGQMRVPVVIFASEALIDEMDAKVSEQACNVASLPGIVGASYAMPDAHWGYGFPIGGVAAFDGSIGGIISAGGVGFDISCGVRTLRTGLKASELEPVKAAIADALADAIPAGLGSTGPVKLTGRQFDEMLTGGARWAIDRGYGEPDDLNHIEENGCMAGAVPGEVSEFARRRQRDEMGTLGSGNHYLEVQRVETIHDETVAGQFGLQRDDILISIHCGSRGLGHQIGTEFLRRMATAARNFGILLPDRELACAPLESDVGLAYLGAMRGAINCAFANRQILTHYTRQVFARFFPDNHVSILYDVSHNTCKEERHNVEGVQRKLFVHRKGATRALGPGHPDLPATLRSAGQPVLIGGSMGTASHILVGREGSEQLSFSSACHGAGRAMSRREAKRRWQGREVVAKLAAQGILIRSPSMRGVAEEAPDAYKDVDEVVAAADAAGLARKIARLVPLICVKG